MRSARYILLRIPRKSRILARKYSRKSSTSGVLSAIISSVTYGLIPLFSIPLMNKGLHFDSVLFYRFFLAALSVALLMLIKNINFKISWKEFKTLILLSILCNTCSLLFFLSYTFLGGGVTTTVHFMYPVFVTIIMGVFFHEKITPKNIVAILIAILGVALLSSGEGFRKINLKGISCALSAAIFYAMFLVFSVKTSVKDMQVLKFTFYIQIIGVIYLLCFCFLRGTFQWFPLQDTSSVINMISLAIIPTIVSTVALVSAVRKIGSTLTSVLGAFEPLTAVIIGIWIFNEPFTLKMLLGIVLIITAVLGIILTHEK